MHLSHYLSSCARLRVKNEEWGVMGCIRNLFNGPDAKFQNPRTTPFGGEVKFTSKAIIVGGEGRVSEMYSSV